MLRDNLAGLIEPMRAAHELDPLALFTEQEKSSDDRPQDALKIPAPKGRNLTLTENAASPFHAEPRQSDIRYGEWRRISEQMQSLLFPEERAANKHATKQTRTDGTVPAMVAPAGIEPA